jgi:uncharacterized membrane protein YczE
MNKKIGILFLCYNNLNETTMLYIAIAFGIFIVAVGVAFLVESKKGASAQ